MRSISFIVPSWHYYADPLKHQPYWELYYATQLKNNGFIVDITDLRLTKKNSLKEAVEDIPDELEEILSFVSTPPRIEEYNYLSYYKIGPFLWVRCSPLFGR